VFLLRPARLADLPELLALARLLDGPNLPPDPEFLRERLARSEAAFASADGPHPEREYQFVLLDPTQRVVGTSALFSKHGSPGSPHISLRVGEEVRCSQSTGIEIRHRTLQLHASKDGPSELGALILQPEMRGRPGSPGKLLSWGRLAYIAGHLGSFEDTLLAELRADLDPAGRNAFWEAFGGRFTGMSFVEADRMSARDKSFILDLFPDTPFYAALLADEVAEQIGQVHPDARPALELLERAGLRWTGEIDPFDAGPMYGAPLSEVTPIVDTSFGAIAPREPGPGTEPRIVVAGTGRQFRAVAAPAMRAADGIRICKEARTRLGVDDGDDASLTPMPRPAKKESR
jgi:arginine N-succinyltransferase